MMTDAPTAPTLYRLVTPYRIARVRQVASFHDGRTLLLALVDKAGQDLGQMVLADLTSARLEPVEPAPASRRRRVRAKRRAPAEASAVGAAGHTGDGSGPKPVRYAAVA